jgi:hypothetical protein
MKQKLNIPPVKDLQQTLKMLKETNLNKVSYMKIVHTLINDIVIIPSCIAKFHQGGPIYRARINKTGEVFTSENDLSYRTDIDKISRFGRANIPHQSMFYGAFESEEVAYPRIVNLFETSELFRNPTEDDGEFIMTVGKWKAKKEFKVIEMVFSKGNIQNVPEIKRAYKYQKALMRKDHPDQIEQIESVLEFFSNEFAKKNIRCDSDYKISSAYSNLVLSQTTDVHGVTYPSVRTDYKANNIALFPDSVEYFLKLEIVGMFKITKNGNNALIESIAIAKDLGPLNSDFKWVNVQGKSDEQVRQLFGV